MARKLYARRYAQAVFEIALERKEPDRWQADLAKIARLPEDTAFFAFLENPKFRFEDKTRLLSERLGDVNPLALNLVYLLVTRGQLGEVGDISNQYQRLLDDYRGIEQAEVKAAVPLDEEDREKLTRQLEEVVGKKVILKFAVDPGIIGGIVARIDGKLLDGSTRSKLEVLKKGLAGAGH